MKKVKENKIHKVTEQEYQSWLGMNIEKHKSAFFDVVERPVIVDGQQLENKKAIVRTDTKDVLSIMSNQYKPVSNQKSLETFAEIAKEAGVLWNLDKCHIIQNGTKTIMEMTFPTNNLVVGKADFNNKRADILEMKGYLTNGFDGMNAVKFEIGFLRLVCKNGMVAFKSDASFYHKHVGAVNDKLVETFRTYLAKEIKESSGHIRQLTQTDFQNKESVKAIIDSSKWIGEKYQEELVNEWKAKRQALNAWVLYNVYTYVITHLMQVNMASRMDFFKKLNRETQNWK